MWINLLWRPFSTSLIPAIWHALRSVIRAGSRHWSSSASLLWGKGNTRHQCRLCAHLPPAEPRQHVTPILTPPSPPCARTAHDLTQGIPHQNSPFQRRPCILWGWKREKVTTAYLSHAFYKLCSWKHLSFNDETQFHVIFPASWCWFWDTKY